MRIKYILLSLGIIIGLGLAIVPLKVDAINVFDPCSINDKSSICTATGTDTVQKYVKIIANTLLYILGAVSVVVIIIAGVGFTTSTGDPAAITKAKSTLMYAVIGLVVAILAYAIVNYVVDKFNTTPITVTPTSTGVNPIGP